MTCEPFYLANSRLPEYGRSSTTPSLVMSLRDLEQWVIAQPDQALEELIAALKHVDQRTWGFSRTMSADRSGRRNPILDAAWHRYDFEEARAAG